MFLEQVQQLKTLTVLLGDNLNKQKSEIRALLIALKENIKLLEEKVAAFNTIDLTEDLNQLNALASELSLFTANADSDTNHQEPAL